MAKMKRNEIENPVKVPTNENGTVDVNKLSPHDRESYRAERILDLKVDELRNGIMQGQWFSEQLEEFKKNDPDNSSGLFSKFCALVGEKPSDAKTKISRFLFVSSIPGGMERESISLLRGTILDKCKVLSQSQVKELSKSLASRLKNVQLTTGNLKKIQSQINGLANAILVKPLGGPGTNPKKILDSKKAPKKSDNPESVTDSAPPVRDIPEFKGFRYPSPDDFNDMGTLAQKTDAIFCLLRAAHKMALHIQDNPEDFVELASFQEVSTLCCDLRTELKTLKVHLEFKGQSKAA